MAAIMIGALRGRQGTELPSAAPLQLLVARGDDRLLIDRRAAVAVARFEAPDARQASELILVGEEHRVADRCAHCKPTVGVIELGEHPAHRRCASGRRDREDELELVRICLLYTSDA